jgi:hypothetical protein
LFLAYGCYITLLKAKVLKPVPPNESPGILRGVITRVFWLAIVTVVLGFAYAGLNISRARYGTPHENSPATVVQQAGPCSTNIAGNGNTSSVDCGKKGEKRK